MGRGAQLGIRLRIQAFSLPGIPRQTLIGLFGTFFVPDLDLDACVWH